MEYLMALLLALLKLPSLLGWAPVFAIGFLIERSVAPAEKSQPLSHLRLNVAYALVERPDCDAGKSHRRRDRYRHRQCLRRQV